MKINTVSIAAGALLLIGGLDAQITQKIQAHVAHSFVIGKNTLPPGDYTFLMQHDSENTIIVTNDSSKKSLNFVVGQVEDPKGHNHGVLVFRKYGDTEYLNKIFQSGERFGVELTESKNKEAKLAGEFTEHSEETK